jgi:hypothetical protein
MNSRSQNRYPRWLPWRALIVASLVFGAFSYGVGVGLYQWAPFSTLQSIKQGLHQSLPVPTAEYQGELELLQYAFTDPVNDSDLYYTAITNLAGIREANERIFMLREGFETAYEELRVTAVDQLNRPQSAQPVVRVTFEYQGNQHEAFAYGTRPVDCSLTRASLIIPGSGLNQSHGIATGSLENYHYGILNALNAGGGGEIFPLIKPNKDFLAWHDGNGKKLGGDFIWNWHLNRGGSYSVSYLVESLAVTKWLQGCFTKTVLVGLSQGGQAVMLNALQSEPNRAIVASGYSLIRDKAEWGGLNQLTGVPGFADTARKEYFVDLLRNSKTLWLFSWGKAENGTYKIEAEEQYAAAALRKLPNVTIVIHDKGHHFPVSEIKSFIELP